MASILTYNNLITVFQDVFNRHYQLQAGMFYAGGDLADTEFLKNNQHPILWVKPVSALLIRNEDAGFYPVKTITMDVHCVDLLNTDMLNREEIQSDMHQALNDIVSEIASHPYYQRSQLTLEGDVIMEPLNEWNDRGAFGWKATLNFKLKNPFDFCGLPLEEIQDFSFPGLGMSGLTYSNPFLTCATLVQCDTFQNYQSFGSISGNSASFNIIYLSGISLTDKFIQIGENISSASTIVRQGTNIYTGGTSLSPIINLVDSPSVNNFTSSGTGYFNTASASTLSAKTIWVTTLSGMSPINIEKVIVQNGTLSANTISGGTYFSGSTPLSQIIQSFISTDQNDITRVQPGYGITTGGTDNFPTINVNSNLALVTFSGGTISGGTFYSGSTPLSTIMQSIASASGDVTRVQPGTNIQTGGTANYPIVNLVDSPFVTNINASGNSIFNILSSTTVTATTFSYLDGLQRSGYVLTSDDNGVASWQAPSANGVLTFMFTSGASDSSNYLSMPSLSNYVISTLAFTARTVTTTPTILASFITESGYPNISIIPTGTITGHYDTQKGAGSNNYYTYFEIYKRSTLGAETLLSTSDTTTQTSVNTRIQNLATAPIISATTISSTDRIVIKVYAVMLSSSASITLYYDDATSSRVELPTLSVDVTNFVPYTGATVGINLNNKSINNVSSLSATSLFATTGNINTLWSATGNIALLSASTLSASTLIGTTIPFASGGTVSTSAQYTIHKFTSTGTTNFITNAKLPIEYLIVGGGGGGCENAGGGGGGGGFVSGSTTIAPSIYPVTVGIGGYRFDVFLRGGNSSIFSIATAIGGGLGGNQNNSYIGGSGGGDRITGSAGILGQGLSGGGGTNLAPYACGGGGGASTPGGNGSGTIGGSGGTGYYSDISGTMTAYAGGGGGSAGQSGVGPVGAGGIGGGGAGGLTLTTGTAGTPNTGGGGGGGGASGGNTASVGGSGIVIIRYPTSALTQSTSYVNAFSSTQLGGVFTPILSANTINFNFGNANIFSATTLNSTTAGLVTIWNTSAYTAYLSATTGNINTISATTGNISTLYGSTGNIASISGTTGAFTTKWVGTANLSIATGTTSNFTTARGATGLFATVSGTTGAFTTEWVGTANLSIATGTTSNFTTARGTSGLFSTVSGTTVASGTDITTGVGGTGTFNRSVIVNGGSTGLAYFGTQQDSVTKAIMGNSNGASALINGSVLGDLCLRNSQKILISADAGVNSNITIASTGEITTGIISASTLTALQTLTLTPASALPSAQTGRIFFSGGTFYCYTGSTGASLRRFTTN